MVDIEKTLSDLALAMQDHREALADRGPARAIADGPAPNTPLHARLERLTGWRTDGVLGAKLDAALALLDPAERDARIAALDPLDWDHPEWLDLIEGLVTSETYLFRDPEQLALVAGAGLAPLIAAARDAARPALRLWSAGCASGEEAYSLAVLALEALVGAGIAREREHDVTLEPGWTLEVLGTDISRPLLAVARAGRYDTGPLSAFRATSAPRLRFFPIRNTTASRADRRVRADIARHVRFAHANLTRMSLPAGSLDVVACRNVLVYFGSAARATVLANLEAAVRPGGLLLLGATDTPPDPHRFEALWGAATVVYRRRA